MVHAELAQTRLSSRLNSTAMPWCVSGRGRSRLAALTSAPFVRGWQYILPCECARPERDSVGVLSHLATPPQTTSSSCWGAPALLLPTATSLPLFPPFPCHLPSFPASRCIFISLCPRHSRTVYWALVFLLSGSAQLPPPTCKVPISHLSGRWPGEIQTSDKASPGKASRQDTFRPHTCPSLYLPPSTPLS